MELTVLVRTATAHTLARLGICFESIHAESFFVVWAKVVFYLHRPSLVRISLTTPCGTPAKDPLVDEIEWVRKRVMAGEMKRAPALPKLR